MMDPILDLLLEAMAEHRLRNLIRVVCKFASQNPVINISIKQNTVLLFTKLRFIHVLSFIRGT